MDVIINRIWMYIVYGCYNDENRDVCISISYPEGLAIVDDVKWRSHISDTHPLSLFGTLKARIYASIYACYACYACYNKFLLGLPLPVPRQGGLLKGWLQSLSSELPHKMPLLIPTRQRQMGNVC